MAKQTENKPTGYKVLIEFKDSLEWQADGQQNTYTIGEDVGHLDPVRLESLVERGLVSKPE